MEYLDDVLTECGNYGRFPISAILQLMCEEILTEMILDKLAPATFKEFYEEYCERHEHRYKEQFIVN